MEDTIERSQSSSSSFEGISTVLSTPITQKPILDQKKSTDSILKKIPTIFENLLEQEKKFLQSIDEFLTVTRQKQTNESNLPPQLLAQLKTLQNAYQVTMSFNKELLKKIKSDLPPEKFLSFFANYLSEYNDTKNKFFHFTITKSLVAEHSKLLESADPSSKPCTLNLEKLKKVFHQQEKIYQEFTKQCGDFSNDLQQIHSTQHEIQDATSSHGRYTELESKSEEEQSLSSINKEVLKKSQEDLACISNIFKEAFLKFHQKFNQSFKEILNTLEKDLFERFEKFLKGGTYERGQDSIEIESAVGKIESILKTEHPTSVKPFQECIGILNRINDSFNMAKDLEEKKIIKSINNEPNHSNLIILINYFYNLISTRNEHFYQRVLLYAALASAHNRNVPFLNQEVLNSVEFSQDEFNFFASSAENLTDELISKGMQIPTRYAMVWGEILKTAEDCLCCDVKECHYYHSSSYTENHAENNICSYHKIKTIQEKFKAISDITNELVRTEEPTSDLQIKFFFESSFEELFHEKAQQISAHSPKYPGKSKIPQTPHKKQNDDFHILIAHTLIILDYYFHNALGKETAKAIGISTVTPFFLLEKHVAKELENKLLKAYMFSFLYNINDLKEYIIQTLDKLLLFPTSLTSHSLYQLLSKVVLPLNSENQDFEKNSNHKIAPFNKKGVYKEWRPLLKEHRSVESAHQYTYRHILQELGEHLTSYFKRHHDDFLKANRNDKYIHVYELKKTLNKLFKLSYKDLVKKLKLNFPKCIFKVKFPVCDFFIKEIAICLKNSGYTFDLHDSVNELLEKMCGFFDKISSNNRSTITAYSKLQEEFRNLNAALAIDTATKASNSHSAPQKKSSKIRLFESTSMTSQANPPEDSSNMIAEIEELDEQSKTLDNRGSLSQSSGRIEAYRGHMIVKKLQNIINKYYDTTTQQSPSAPVSNASLTISLPWDSYAQELALLMQKISDQVAILYSPDKTTQNVLDGIIKKGQNSRQHAFMIQELKTILVKLKIPQWPASLSTEKKCEKLEITDPEEEAERADFAAIRRESPTATLPQDFSEIYLQLLNFYPQYNQLCFQHENYKGHIAFATLLQKIHLIYKNTVPHFALKCIIYQINSTIKFIERYSDPANKALLHYLKKIEPVFDKIKPIFDKINPISDREVTISELLDKKITENLLIKSPATLLIAHIVRIIDAHLHDEDVEGRKILNSSPQLLERHKALSTNWRLDAKKLRQEIIALSSQSHSVTDILKITETLIAKIDKQSSYFGKGSRLRENLAYLILRFGSSYSPKNLKLVTPELIDRKESEYSELLTLAMTEQDAKTFIKNHMKEPNIKELRAKDTTSLVIFCLMLEGYYNNSVWGQSVVAAMKAKSSNLDIPYNNKKNSKTSNTKKYKNIGKNKWKPVAIELASYALAIYHENPGNGHDLLLGKIEQCFMKIAQSGIFSGGKSSRLAGSLAKILQDERGNYTTLFPTSDAARALYKSYDTREYLLPGHANFQFYSNGLANSPNKNNIQDCIFSYCLEKSKSIVESFTKKITDGNSHNLSAIRAKILKTYNALTAKLMLGMDQKEKNNIDNEKSEAREKVLAAGGIGQFILNILDKNITFIGKADPFCDTKNFTDMRRTLEEFLIHTKATEPELEPRLIEEKFHPSTPVPMGS